MNAWRLLLTRPAPESAALAATLAAQGVFSSSLPLLQIEALAETAEQRELILALPRYSAVIVVSKPAARLGLELLQRYWPQVPAAPRWFSVGAATAQILADAGVAVNYPSDGDDSEALLALPALTQALAGPSPRVLIMRGEGGREFIADCLRGQGATVDYLPLYRRGQPDYPATALLAQLDGQQLNAVLVSSGEGFARLRQLAADDWPQVARRVMFVPSARVAEQARAAGVEMVVDCRGASAAALLAALRATPQPAP